MSPPLILGSSSPYRAELLARLGVPFDQRSPDVDEAAVHARFHDSKPEEIALELARAKIAAIQSQEPNDDRWILCADQVGVLLDADGRGGQQLLTKPGTVERCIEQLLAMSGRTHELINGVVLSHPKTGESHVTVDRQMLTMRPFSRLEAESYVEAYSPLDTAGGYRIEDAGILLFERVRSDDFTGIVGLPLIATGKLLRAAGLIDGD